MKTKTPQPPASELSQTLQAINKQLPTGATTKLATQVGVTPAYVSQILNGKPNNNKPLVFKVMDAALALLKEQKEAEQQRIQEANALLNQ